MAKIELLSDSSDSQVFNNKEPFPTPKTITFPLTGQPGEAVFNVPTIGNAIASESANPNLAKIELYRKMAANSLISWGDKSSMPPDEEIDIADDFAIIELFSVDTTTGTFDVLPDKSHSVQLSVGLLLLRRPSRVDVRKVESLTSQVQAGKMGGIMSDLMWACDLCVKWWKDSRSIMPGDFNELPLSDYANIGAALQAFFPRRTALIRG
jgi:hypothetical protein